MNSVVRTGSLRAGRLMAVVLLSGVLAGAARGEVDAAPRQTAPKDAPATDSAAKGAPQGTVLEGLTAEEIVNRNLAARGGAATWDKITSLAWLGHIESERLPDHEVKFSLEEVRPNKTRFDILGTHPSQRIFDGSKGWNVHPREDGMPQVDSFSKLEESFAREAPGLAWPLITFRSQNRPIAFLGRDTIEGRDCYRLGVHLPSGSTQYLWVDAATFLELRLDRPTHSSRGGASGMVSVYYREYRDQGGLQIPTVIEIGGGAPGTKPDRMVIERLAINPEISAARFLKPPSPPHKHEFTVQPQLPAPGGPRGP